MKKVMFYCQHILGIGHLIRSMEIVRGLVQDSQVCFINGGEVIKEFEAPQGVEVINIPGIKTDSQFQELQVVNSSQSLEEVELLRKKQLLSICEEFQPDILIVELFPFGRRRFSFELIPLLEKAKAMGTKVVCSLRDIVVTKQNQVRHEEKVCRLINQYFDMLLIHGDRKFVSLEASFSRVRDLNCEVHYTGYVAQPLPKSSQATLPITQAQKPTILVSVGGGRFGHELLKCVAETALILKHHLPHQIIMFTGPFVPESVFAKLKKIALGQTNITIERYTPNLLHYMQQADLSLSMSGYNTTMNILMTGVRAMILPFTGNNDQEQTIRAEKLGKLGRVKVIRPEDLRPEIFAHQIIEYLDQQPTDLQFDFGGVEKTASYLRQLFKIQELAA